MICNASYHDFDHSDLLSSSSFFKRIISLFMPKNLSALLLIFCLFSCKPTHFTPGNYKSAQLKFGSRGGVTGVFKEFTLLENGQLFLSRGVGKEVKELTRRNRGETNRIFRTAAELSLGTLKFSHPGNVTSYLVLKNPKKTNEISWGDPGFPPPAGIKEFYDHLLVVVQP